MTVKKAERIIGLPVNLNLVDGAWVASVTNTEYGFTVTAAHNNKLPCICLLIERNYNKLRQIVMDEQMQRCIFCSRLGPLQIDHIIPRSRERLDHRANLRAADLECHERRHRDRKFKPAYTVEDLRKMAKAAGDRL